MQTRSDRLQLTVFGCHIEVVCHDRLARALLVTNYGQLQRSGDAADLRYTVGRPAGSSAFFVVREGQPPLLAADAGELLFLFEKDMTIELQKLRPKLFFVHSAALEFGGNAVLLVGASGSGKSTLTWALLHHGLGYLSDELGPIDIETAEVHPYPHALCLKDEPPGPYPLPGGTLVTARAMYIPVQTLPSRVGTAPLPLVAIFCVRYLPETSTPTVRRLGKAEAGTRLFSSALNPLAHPGDGLDAAIKIALRTACFEVLTGDLPTTCTLVEDTLMGVLGNG
jgi:hypothetical protein